MQGGERAGLHHTLAGSDAAPGRCWLCGRVLDARVQQHHTVPKAKGGRATVPLHPICHKAIHANFTNAQLVRIGVDRAALLENAELAGFVAWVANKPPNFHAPTRTKRR